MTAHDTRSLPCPASFEASGPLLGSISIPGDKSISHRAVILSALAVGESRISGLSNGHDVKATAAAMRAMGATIEPSEKDGLTDWSVYGVGVGGLMQPLNALDMGNSGTSTRLLMGLVASHPITATFIGDSSLSLRPMNRVIEPLSAMGANITASPGGMLPLMVRGLCPAIPLSYRLPVASAQVKSAILFAGLNTAGVTEIIEPIATRDHSERMLQGFGANLTIAVNQAGVRRIRLTGEAELRPQHIVVPGDISSAAFFIVAALIVPESNILIHNVGMNPARTGLIAVLRTMGAEIVEVNRRTTGGEPVADLRVRHSRLIGVEVAPSLVPDMIDEFPALFIAASVATGRTVAKNLSELRVKESDRLASMAAGLKAIGARATEQADAMIIDGVDSAMLAGGAKVAGRLDHRICMSFAIAGLVSRSPVTIDDISPVATSFPGFAALLARLQKTL